MASHIHQRSLRRQQVMLLCISVIFSDRLFSSSSHSPELPTPSAAAPESKELSNEAEALLRWKDSLLYSPQLDSWKRPLNASNAKYDATSPCDWNGVQCDDFGFVVAIALAGCGLAGTLDNLNFSSFPALTSLDLSSNMLHGSIPPSVSNLRRILFLDLSNNLLTGNIPLEITSLSGLQSLKLSWNQLNGSIPASIGTKLCNLTSLSLSRNQLSGSIPPQLGFLKLQVLDLHHNGLTGDLSNNLFTTNWSRLNKLVLSINNLVGKIPHNISLISSLQQLDLSKNQLNGPIPPLLGNLGNLSILVLSSNRLSGQIPPSFGNLINLVLLSIHTNQISGSIPPTFWNLARLQNINMFGNSLSGQIPPQIGNLSTLIVLDLSSNDFNGPIPPEILDLLSHLNTLNLSHNSFSGLAPIKHIPKISPSTFVDFSYNNLQFPLDYNGVLPPQAMIGNKGFLITESSTNTEYRHHKTIEIILILGIPVFLLAVSLLLFLYIKFHPSFKRRGVQIDPLVANEMTSSNLFSIWNFDGKMVFEDILEATENFEDIYCLGTGANGSVYEAELKTGQVVAVKRFHQADDGVTFNGTTFHNEIQALAQIRHCNIVKLYGFCCHTRYMFMVYEYMERGSLFSILSNRERAVELDWGKRIKTVKGVADALCYMHHDCKPAIIHRDIKSSNILLDSKFRACVSDFGTAKILSRIPATGQTLREHVDTLLLNLLTR